MSKDQPDNLPVQFDITASPEVVSLKQESQLHLKHLRSDANKLLKQLMLEQQARLNQMVHQLQNPTADSDKITEPEQHSDNDAQNATAQSNIDANLPLQDVTRLQQQNMLHLDAVMARINANIASSLNISADDNKDLSKGASDGKTETNI